ncbi:uncharacterized protein LOC111642192, partial [Centruroides sculpturatus]|uniref:uncharacterized protein LOC111642192 n=1 Tax=Centruroides sculpturatus TaxID=218467 RepID=UPI000C6DB5CB
ENAELQNALQALETNTSTSFLSSENEKLNEDASEKDVLSTLENNTEVEEQELSSQDCVLVQLQNGIVAYGNRETLETEWDNIEEYCNKKNTVNEISLLTELDAQYRDLTEKYDSLISSRKQVNSDITSFSEIEGLDDSPNSFSVTSMESENIKIPCNSLPYQTNCKYVDIGVQTEISGDINTNHSHKKILNLNSVNPLSGHFDHSCPTYKKLFEEIFSILKRSLQVDETEKSDIKSSSENDKQVFNNEVPNKVTINPNSCRKFTYAEVLLNGKTKQKVIPL